MISIYKYFVFLFPYSSSSFCTRNKRSFVVFLFSLRYLLGVLREQNGKRSMLIKDVTNVETAVSVLQEVVALPVKE